MKSKTLLFCIPHAGGNAGFYLPLVEQLPAWLRGILVELPGRGTRSVEPLCTEFEVLAADVTSQIGAELVREDHPRYALFGHSMGALLAYCASRALADTPPCHVFLSSPAGLSRRRRTATSEEQGVHTLPQETFLGMLQQLGGLSEEVLASRPLMEYVEPILRADFTALETWTPPLLPPLSLPMTVLNGNEEKALIGHWASRTTGPFSAQRFSGGHFYLSAHWKELADVVAQGCQQDGPSV